MESNSVCNHTSVKHTTRESDLFNHEYDRTDRIRRHEVLLPINHNYNKICDILDFCLIKTRNSGSFLACSEKSQLSARVRWRVLSYYTVLLVLKSGQLIANQI